MKILQILSAVLIGALMFSGNVNAQSNRDLQQLSTLNRINPIQNPEFERSDEIIGRKIIDRKNKVVGNVSDVILNQNGTIASINTEFDRLRLRDEVGLNFRTLRIRSTSDAYALNMDADEISDFYPQLLANIETASGDNDNTFSTRKLLGATLRVSDGRKLGKVEQILFGANGGIASAVYAELEYGTLRGEKIAIPFRSVKFKSERGRILATVSPELADAMVSIADD